MSNCFINKAQLFQVDNVPMPIIKKFKMNYKGFFPL
jgi:hypothetical protein